MAGVTSNAQHGGKPVRIACANVTIAAWGTLKAGEHFGCPFVSLADEGIGERMQSARLICTRALVEVAWILVQKRSELRRQS